ncbi:hypothetical protein [Amycolatopsis japonica]|uniref:hypothetical protein n=1 Tax=Amycolatopsis japonica TaxID=208439 RepID=UPI0033D56145
MPTVTRNGRRRRSPDPSIQPSRGATDFWTFLLCVLREPSVARAAMKFTIAAGAFVIIIVALGVLAFILHPVETHAIVGTVFARPSKP